MIEKDSSQETIVFGGGCFWCTEAIFRMLNGVISITPGYAGGQTPNPTYEEVCSKTTGHAEVVQIVFDPSKTSLNDLFTVFFATHDPTTPNRQGHDIGEQYRSIILYTTDAQRQEAETFINALNVSSTHGNPIVTEIKPLETFYPAENYHQNYYSKNKDAGYCQVVIEPKLEKVKTQFAALLASSNS